MPEHKKSRVTAVRSAEVEMLSSSSVMDISIRGTNRVGGDFSMETGSRCESEAEADKTERELVEG